MAYLEESGGLSAAALAAVPGCESGKPPDLVQRLPGGRGCNDIRLLQTSAGRFVLRTRLDPLDRPGAVARQELNSHRAAARIGCAPPIIAAAEDGRWLLMPYIESRRWQVSDLREISAIEVLGGRLGELHSRAGITDCEPLDAMALAVSQRELILARGPAHAAEVQGLTDQVRQSSDALAHAGARAVLNHGDLHVSNLLGRPVQFVDWEYAQVADPTYDIACLLVYYPELVERQTVLLAAAGLSLHSDGRRLAVQQRLFSALNRLWVLANDIDAG